MKNMILLISLIGLASCHTPPETYKKGVANMNEKKWDNAIESFNAVTVEDEDWLDSATQKKNAAFISLMNEGDWKRTFRVLEKNQDDDDFYFSATDNIEKLFFGLVEKGKVDSVLALLDLHKPKLIEHIDSIFTNAIIRQCEDSLFAGVWEGHSTLKGQEIYFKREGKEFHAYSNKSLNGWKKDVIIYKDMHYSGAKVWKVNPKIFQSNYWGETTSTYYSKKGSIVWLSKDTIRVEYETLGNEKKFSRKK